jgi:uncharacterized membrane protein YfcA
MATFGLRTVKNRKKGEARNMPPLKFLGELFEFLFIPLSSALLFAGTFLGGALQKIENPFVKMAVVFLVVCIGCYYLARVRKIWKEGTEISKRNDQNQN